MKYPESRSRWLVKNAIGRPGIYWLPNAITTCALFFGFFAIVQAMNLRFELAAMGIFIAMVFDGLDGRVARLTRTQSAFGAEYDSLSDMVAFGAAPAYGTSGVLIKAGLNAYGSPFTAIVISTATGLLVLSPLAVGSWRSQGKGWRPERRALLFILASGICASWKRRTLSTEKRRISTISGSSSSNARSKSSGVAAMAWGSTGALSNSRAKRASALSPSVRTASMIGRTLSRNGPRSLSARWRRRARASGVRSART